VPAGAGRRRVRRPGPLDTALDPSTPTAHLQRLCQTIETLLPDPDLSLRRVADEEGVSPRYVQKLFASANETFSHYLRSRRLERCRIDLASPQHARLSISEICFRWGFNGSAHFSRAFREQYGRSPREFRNACEAGVSRDLTSALALKSAPIGPSLGSLSP